MEIYFLRHGIAYEHDQWTGTDRSRPLTQEGSELMVKQADVMRRLQLPFDVIITSPLKRAKQTASIIHTVFEKLSLVEDDAMAMGFDVKQLAQLLTRYPQYQAPLLVGHEPDLSTVIGALIGGGAVKMKKGSLAKVALYDNRRLAGELAWLMPANLMVNHSA